MVEAVCLLASIPMIDSRAFLEEVWAAHLHVCHLLLCCSEALLHAHSEGSLSSSVARSRTPVG